jgi:hypothetical protein
VGPLLLIVAHRQGAAAGAQAATGSLLGIVAFSGFLVAYGRAATRHAWPVALTLGWAAAAILAQSVAGSAAGSVVALAMAAAALAAAHLLLPRAPVAVAPTPSSASELARRMAVTLALVAALAVAADRFGALVGGIASALPALASVLVVATHRRAGGVHVVALLRGMLAGMTGFVAFCAVVALFVEPLAVPATFALATVVAVAAQALAWARPPVSA